MNSAWLGLPEVGRHVLGNCWRSRPTVFRHALLSKSIARFDKDRFLVWTDQTVGSVRLFEAFTDGSSRSGLLPDTRNARELFTKLQAAGTTFTIHMNDVEMVDKDIFELRQAFGIPYWWRIDDVIGTLSSPGSGIGYHAGHEDGFIVQLSGSRRWRVWSESCTPVAYRYELLAPSHGPNPVIVRPDSDVDLLLDVVLSAGDVLYIPPYFPHEGVTIETSVSLSIAWKGLGPVSFLPSWVAARISEGEKSRFMEKAVALFDEVPSADIALSSWLKASVNVTQDSFQSDMSNEVEMAIESHFFKLSRRYCDS